MMAVEIEIDKTTLYVREQGAVVRKRGERIIITKEDRELGSVPLVNLEQVALVGNVQLTTPAAALLLQNEIEVVFFTFYLKILGRLVGPGSKNAALRVAQLKAVSNDGLLLNTAKAVVMGKLHNQRVVMQRQAAQRGTGPAGAALRQAVDGIGKMRTSAEGAANIDSLRGHEGMGGKFYFAGVKALLDPRWGFEGRMYNPPPDPINAALSLGYSLLRKDVEAAIQIVGLDPYLGFFHVIEYGRPSLALDLMEEFRPIIVDGLVLAMVHNGQLTPADFVRTGSADRPVQLSDAGVKRLMDLYTQRLLTETQHPLSGDTVTYRRCLEAQARQIAALVQGRAQRYVPVLIR
jgi:CRISP-associated protein Cas1